MAEPITSDDTYYPYPEATNEDPTYGDYAKSAASGLTGGVLAPGAALSKSLTANGQNPTSRFIHEMSGILQRHLNEATENINESRTDVAKKRAESAITSSDFWEHPASAAALKVTNMTPSVAAMVFSGGPVGAALVGGALGAGSYDNEIDRFLDDKSDDELKENKYYESIRSMGMSESDARTALKAKVTGNKELLNFVVGTLQGALGPGAKLAGAVTGKTAIGLAGAESGAAARAGYGALEGAVGGAAQGGTENATVQQAELETGLKKEFDQDALINAVLEPGALGGVLGGAVGAATGRGRSRTKSKSEIQPADINETAKTTGPVEQAAPPENVAVGNPESAPVGSQTKYPKVEIKKDRNRKKKTEPVADVVEPLAPTEAELIAIKDKQQPETPKAAPIDEPPVQQVTPEVTPERTTPVQNEAVQTSPEAVARPDVISEAPPPIVEAPRTVPTAEPEVQATPPRTGRILKAIKSPEEQAAIDEANKAATKQMRQNAKDVLAAESGEEKPSGKHWTKEQLATREGNAEAARRVFEEHTPEDASIPTTPAEREALRSRLDAMLRAADDAKIKIPVKVGYDSTSDHIVYLRAAKDLHKKLGQKGFVGARREKQIADFLVGERAAKKGDFSVLRDTRRVEGDLTMRRDQGDVEARAATSDMTAGAGAEAEPVRTAIPKSSRGSVRDSSSEDRAASPVRKVELTEEAKRWAMKSLERAEKKARGEVNTTRLDETVHSKPPVPEATSAKVVDRAANKTNTEPTEAQKKAGNYAKGVVKWHGMDVAIENPKGSKRTGKDPNGKEWSVEMPDHYGYIKRTEGADGDQVDVYMGPNPKSEKVFVVEQRDLRTEKFDEHKAMLGYDDRAAAMQAYDRAFSDGRGFERIGDIQEMTPDEFKAWAKSDQPKKAHKEAAHTSEAVVDAMRTDPFGSAPHDAITHEAIKPIATRTAREALDSLDLSHLGGVPHAIQSFMLKRLKVLVGDTPVHIVSKEDMARATGEINVAFDSDGRGILGLHRVGIDGASHVLLRSDALTNSSRAAHVVLHELTHNATVRALVEDPGFHNVVKQMMKETEAFLEHVPDIRKMVSYGLENPREFIAEAFSNAEFQDIMAQIPVSKELAAKLRLDQTRKWSAWDALVTMVRNAVERITGKLPDSPRMIDAIMRVGEQMDIRKSLENSRDRTRGRPLPLQLHGEPDAIVSQLRGDLREHLDKLQKQPMFRDEAGRPWALALRTVDQIAQAAEHYFGGNNPVRKIADLLEMTRVKAGDYLKSSEPLVTKLYDLEKKYSKQVGENGKSKWEEFTELVHDETMSSVFADRDLASQAHLGKDTLDGAWSKTQHADLARRFASMPEDLRAARLEAMKYFTDRQNDMSLGVIKNRILKALGVDDDALARRIHEGTTTDADAQRLGPETLKLISEAKELAKIKGPYFPLMRRGNFVVRGRIKVDPPANAKRLNDNEFEFTSRKEALDWAKAQDTRPTVKSVWVDKATGDQRFPDGTKVTPKDVDAEQRFRVTMQDKHVEFFESQRDAMAAHDELVKHGLADVTMEEKRFEPGDRRSDMLSSQMKQLVTAIERRQTYKDMTAAQKNDVIQALNEASIRFLGSTRIQSRRLPRRFVEGASRDLTRNTLDYAQSSSAYLAKLEHHPALEEAMKAMREQVGANENKITQFGRSSIANEIERRVSSSATYDEGKGGWNAVTKRLMTLSFLDKLFSPAFNIINSLQPAMVTMPTLAGRFGVGRTFDAMSRAYRDISAAGIVKQGVKNTANKTRGHDTSNIVDDIKSRLTNSRERAMLDYLIERGSLDPDAGMEIATLIRQRDGFVGKVDTGLSYMDGIARQMPQAIEAINRSVTALAAYRLEMARSGNHETAMRYAQEAVNNTQGLYSATNAPAIFNHPVAKLSLQFKKYGQMMYHLLGSNIGKALRNAQPGDRAEALKVLGGLTATHVTMAGALGLPTEPFKYLLMGANAAGLTSTGWNDVEDAVRTKASNYFGKTGGEVLTRGLPRLAGIDLSSRVGLDSVFTFGEPKSNKDTDVKSWLFDTLAGAPAALVGDWVKGANQLTAGNFTKAAELMVPNKFAADSIRAYRQLTEGKKTAAGRQTMGNYTPREAVVRALGFTPEREAEDSARRGAFYGDQKRQSDERHGLIGAWVSARPSDKHGAYRAIQKWNVGKPKEAQISMKDLTSAAKRRDTEDRSGTVKGGIRTTKRDRHIFERTSATYN